MKGNNWLKKVRHWFWPTTCLLCGAPVTGEGHFCPGCTRALPWLGPACQACASPLPREATICGACQQHTFTFFSARACFCYATPVDTLIHRLKYGRDLALARALGETWIQVHGGMQAMRADVIIPIPLHVSRLRKRGFNQSLEIARPLARYLGIPLDPNVLVRTRATAPQTTLDHKQRSRNVRDAFAADHTLAGKHVALVDDVMTSGYTANEAANAALEAGARSVAVWVLARA